jgi:hypothetical protein
MQDDLLPHLRQPDRRREVAEHGGRHENESQREAQTVGQPLAPVAMRGQKPHGNSTAHREGRCQAKNQSHTGQRARDPHPAGASPAQALVEGEQGKQRDHEIAEAEEKLVNVAPRRSQGDQQTGEQRKGRAHQAPCEQVGNPCQRDVESSVDQACRHQSRRIPPPGQPGRPHVSRRKHPEDVVVEDASGLQPHRSIELPGLVEAIQPVVDEARLVQAAHGNYDRQPPPGRRCVRGALTRSRGSRHVPEHIGSLAPGHQLPRRLVAKLAESGFSGPSGPRAGFPASSGNRRTSSWKHSNSNA